MKSTLFFVIFAIMITTIFKTTGNSEQSTGIYNMTVTSYNPVESQTDSTPFITACNTYPHEGTIALSRDYFTKKLCGHKIEIIGRGVYIINDTMGKTVKRGGVRIKQINAIDICTHSYEKARKWGIKKIRIKYLGFTNNKKNTILNAKGHRINKI